MANERPRHYHSHYWACLGRHDSRHDDALETTAFFNVPAEWVGHERFSIADCSYLLANRAHDYCRRRDADARLRTLRFPGRRFSFPEPLVGNDEKYRAGTKLGSRVAP